MLKVCSTSATNSTYPSPVHMKEKELIKAIGGYDAHHQGHKLGYAPQGTKQLVWQKEIKNHWEVWGRLNKSNDYLFFHFRVNSFMNSFFFFFESDLAVNEINHSPAATNMNAFIKTLRS